MDEESSPSRLTHALAPPLPDASVAGAGCAILPKRHCNPRPIRAGDLTSARDPTTESVASYPVFAGQVGSAARGNDVIF